jgi:hypothetical protein
MHNEEVHNLYSSLCIRNGKDKKDEMGRTSSKNGERRNTYRLLARKPEGKKALERSISKW